MIYKDKKVAIIGYGIEGKDVEKFLISKGAIVTVLDQKESADYLSDLSGFDIIVRSPGVYPFKKELLEAKKKGIRITTPTHIFFDEFNGYIIGITGTKGKGTTSTLIYEILKNAKFDVHLGGNIGIPLLENLEKINNKSYVVMELSSFQLIDLPVSPDIAVVLNITSDHMDWHKDKDEYLSAKKNIVKFQKASDWSVINSEYSSSKSFAEETKGNVIFFSKKTLSDNYKDNLTLRGEHNLENISAAVAVAKILNIKEEVILKTVKEFKGLEHRLEFVREYKTVKYYNDSFATGPHPTIAALKSFTEDITLIAGGSDKGLDYKEIGEFISKSKNIKNIILIGQIRNEIRKYVKNNDIKIYDLATASMSEIVKIASEVTSSGGVVVLSPAAASFDMFKDYKDRGEQFKEAVNNL